MTEATNVRILDQRTPEERDRPFLPGMGRTWLLPLYDIFTRLVGGRALHGRAVELAGIVPGQAVVDVGWNWQPVIRRSRGSSGRPGHRS